MNGFPSRESVARIRSQYPAGSRVELISMNDLYTELKSGDCGTVEFEDDTGSIFVKWDSGSGLAVVYGVDVVRKTG